MRSRAGHSAAPLRAPYKAVKYTAATLECMRVRFGGGSPTWAELRAWGGELCDETESRNGTMLRCFLATMCRTKARARPA